MGSNLFRWYFMGFSTKMFVSTETKGFAGDLLHRCSSFNMVPCEDIGDLFEVGSCSAKIFQ